MLARLFWSQAYDGATLVNALSGQLGPGTQATGNPGRDSNVFPTHNLN
jgi:hypothetical protein